MYPISPSQRAFTAVVWLGTCAMIATEVANALPSTDYYQVGPALSALPCVEATHAVTQDFVDINPLIFKKNVDEWKKKSLAMSSITEMAMLPAYQRIIGMGQSAIPLLLAQLRSEGNQPDMWFWALQAITGVDPVGSEHAGDMVAMATAWLDWGTRNNVS